MQGVLQEYVRRYTRQYGTEFEVTVFADGVDILEDYRAVYDIIFSGCGDEASGRHDHGRAHPADGCRRHPDLHHQYGAVRHPGLLGGSAGLCAEAGAVFCIFRAAEKGREKFGPPRQPLSGPAGGGRDAAAGQLPASIIWKARDTASILYRRGRFFGTGHPQGSGGKAGGPPLCPLQQRLSGKSGAGAGGAAEHGAGGTL